MQQRSSCLKRNRGGILVWVIPICLAAVGAVLLYHWLDYETEMQFAERVPDPNAGSGMDDGTAGEIVGKLVSMDGVPADIEGSWPQFRGKNRDAILADETNLARDWPPEGPRVLWTIDVGMGYAGAAISKGRAYVVDYDVENKRDVIRCLSLQDGRDIWQYSYGVKVKPNHGVSRTIPTVTDKYVISMGPKCHVTCLDAETGEQQWLLNLVKDYGAKVPAWYAGQCPLVDDGKVILGVGGDALVMAVDPNSGEVVWQSENPKNWLMTHSSLVPVDVGGRKIYIYCASGGIVGVSADDGQIVWEYPDWKIRIANVPTPVPVGSGRVFFSGGYNAGSLMLELTEENGSITATEIFRHKASTFGSDQQTPVFYEGHIYGVRPDKQLVCMDMEGNILWTSTNENKFGLGPYTIVNGIIYVMDDEGVLTMVEATPNAYVQLDQADILEGHESWGPMAAAAGRLIVRDMYTMACVDISKQ